MRDRLEQQAVGHRTFIWQQCIQQRENVAVSLSQDDVHLMKERWRLFEGTIEIENFYLATPRHTAVTTKDENSVYYYLGYKQNNSQ